METVPGAIISIEKCLGDIEPFDVMQDYFFRIKGIKIKFRNCSTAFNVPSLVGKPLALDKNFFRNFSHIRVKIGCWYVFMVPCQDW
jgi:hypothetical protein